MSGGNFVTLGPVPDPQNDKVSQLAFAFFNVAIFPGGTIVPAISGKRISLHGLFLGFTGNTQGAVIEATTAGATVTSQIGNIANFGGIFAPNFILPYSQYPWATASPGNALSFVTTGATVGQAGGVAIYVQG